MRAAHEVARRLDRELTVCVIVPDEPNPTRVVLTSSTSGQQGPRLTVDVDGADVRVDAMCPPDDPWHRAGSAVAEMHAEILSELLSEPDREPAACAGISAASRAAVLGPMAGTEVDHGPYRSVPDQVLEVARAQPDAPAVQFGGDTLTYRQFVMLAAGLGARLAEAGVTPGALIPVVIGNSLAMPVAYQALMGIRAAFVPVDPRWPASRLAQVLDVLDAPVVLCTGTGQVPAEHRAKAMVVDLDAVVPAEPGPIDARQDDLIYGIFTSGTTGTPRCALNTHGGLTNRLAFMTRWFGEHPDVVLQNTKHTYDSAFWQLFWPLTTGGTTVIPDHTEYLDLHRIIDLIDAHHVTVTDFVPTILSAFLALAEREPGTVDRLRSLRHVVVGGEEINPHTVHRLQELLPGLRVSNGYGPTEAAIGMIFHEVVKIDGDDVPLGRPIDNCLAVVVDAEGRPLPPGATGEILIGGACLGIGYHGVTTDRFIPNPFPELRTDRLYRTGDLGHVDELGRFCFDGRTDHQVKIGGVRVELGEIEVTAETFPGVEYATALLIDGELVLAAAGAGLHAEPMQDHLRAHLPRTSVPHHCVILPELPLSDGGKVDRGALAAIIERERAERTRLLATGGDDPTLRVLRRVLGSPTLGEHDDFFTAGGNSLHALAAATELSDDLGVPFGVRDLMLRPTAAGLRELVADRRRGRDTVPDHRALVEADVAVDLPAPGRWAPRPVRSVLLTGATGFVGTQLLHELVTRTDARVVCLVRGDDDRHARRRLEAAMHRYRRWQAEHADRIEVVAGDLGRPRFGLDRPRWNTLAAGNDLVLHNGALVNLLFDYRVHREANVLGTAEVLRLSRHGGMPLHHVSTLGVLFEHAQRLGTPVPEDVDVDAVTPPRSGYSHSKWAAERLLAAAAAQGGPPITVLRLGEVLPATTTGVPNALALTHLLVSAMHRFGVAPRAALRSDYSPADRVAAVVVAAVLDRAVWGRPLHVFSPGGVSFEALLDRVTPVSCAQFIANLRAAASDDEIALLVGMLPHDLDAADETAARRALEGLLQDNPALFDRSRCAELERRAGIGAPAADTGFAAYRQYLDAGHRALAGA